MLLQNLLSDAALNYPEQTALIDGSKTINYCKLAQTSANLAEKLRNNGVSKGQRIGICLQKSFEAIIAIWAVLQTGAAYVPLDPASPSKRLTSIIHDCQLAAIITTKQIKNSLDPHLKFSPSFITLAEKSSESANSNIEFDFESSRHTELYSNYSDRGEEDLAYIFYTSGSTGKPKGVMISHNAALAFINWAAAEVKLTVKDRVASHAPLYFDLSIFDVFATCKAGAALVLIPPKLALFPKNLADQLTSAGITVSYSVPSLLKRLVSDGALERFDWIRLRHIIFAGEVFPVEYLRRLREIIPHAEYSNWYGPTETNVCTAYRVKSLEIEQRKPIPIGIVCSHYKSAIVNERKNICLPEEIGELYISGTGLMDGYWNAPEQTQMVLQKTTFDSSPPADWYRTGDIVRQDNNGQIHFIGRQDDMLKIRGYRIEAGEIENVLHRHPEVAETIVLAMTDQNSEQILQAFIVPKSGATLIAPALKSFCAEYLPGYMIPQLFVFKTKLPLTPSGKIDRQLLRTQADDFSS